MSLLLFPQNNDPVTHQLTGQGVGAGASTASLLSGDSLTATAAGAGGSTASLTVTAQIGSPAVPPTWVVQQTLKSGDENTAAVNNALGKPGILGFSQRNAINVLYPDGVNLTSTLIDSGKSVANSHSVAHCIRFMTGMWMPAQYYRDGGAFTTQNFFSTTLGTPTASFTNSATSFTLTTASPTTVVAGDMISAPTIGPAGTANITLAATCYAGDTTVSIVAGSWPGTVNAGATVTCFPAVPLPWDDTSASGRNEIFEGYFTTFCTGLAAWCRANNDPILHIPWYSGQFAELFLSVDITGYTGAFGTYSYTKFINGHKKLVDIADAVKGPDLQVEAPMSGTGNLTNQGGHDTVGDLSSYIATKTNASTQWIVQLNGLDYGAYYNSPHDQPFTILAGQTDPAHYTNELNQENSALNASVGHAFQARQNADEDWADVFTQASPASGTTPALEYWGAEYVEIYPASFNAGQPHLADLLTYVAAGAKNGKSTANLTVLDGLSATAAGIGGDTANLSSNDALTSATGGVGDGSGAITLGTPSGSVGPYKKRRYPDLPPALVALYAMGLIDDQQFAVLLADAEESAGRAA